MTDEKEMTDEQCADAIANDLSLTTDELLLEIYKEAANTAQAPGPQLAKTAAKSAILSLSIIKEQAVIHHHLAKLTNRGRATNFEKLSAEIVGGLDDFPTHMALPDQGRFALGYYHQRQDFFTKKDKPETAQA